MIHFGTVDQSVKRLNVTPLRYPGGKAALYPAIRAVIRANDLTEGAYVEPYAGGAGAAIALLVTGEIRRVVINDLDSAIYAFWVAVTDYWRDFASLVRSVPLSVDEWVKQKAIYTCKPDDPLALGFATFYLNRTNRSGVLNAGPIGGMNQAGNYKIDARFNRDALAERVRLIGLHRKAITVANRDGLDIVNEFAGEKRTLIYADPPYFEKAGSLYMNSFESDDHAKLATCLNEHKQSPWMLTYDNVQQVSDLYTHRRRREIQLNYSARHVRRATEILVLSDGLVEPD